MSSTTDDDGSSSEDLSNLLALAAENLAPEKRAGGGPREAPVVRDFADDRARVAALAAIADRAAALPPYAGDDAETDAVFDELLELHASIAASDVSAEAQRSNASNATAPAGADPRDSSMARVTSVSAVSGLWRLSAPTSDSAWSTSSAFKWPSPPLPSAPLPSAYCAKMDRSAARLVASAPGGGRWPTRRRRARRRQRRDRTRPRPPPPPSPPGSWARTG